MKLICGLLLLSIVACEAKKSTGTTSKTVAPAITKKELAAPNLKSRINVPKSEDCSARATELDTPITDGVSITSSELVTGEKAHYELESIEAKISTKSGEIKLIERRMGRRYFQSCKNLEGLSAFEIRYGAPHFFSATDGSFGKLNGQRKIGTKYILRFDPQVKNGRARASFLEVKLSGTIQDNLADQSLELSNANLRYFRMENGDIVIRTQKDGLGDGTLRVNTVMKFALKAK